jgi:putative mRNA 3-end processing factor
MRIKQRAKARNIELPLVISDHADWSELTETLDDVGAPEIWVTHGREEALVHYARQQGRQARALALTGFDDEEE